MSRAEIIVLAKELGFELSEADFQQHEELSDDELDAVAVAPTETMEMLNPIWVFDPVIPVRRAFHEEVKLLLFP